MKDIDEKELKRTIRSRDRQIDDLQRELRKITADRDLYRDWVDARAAWFLELMDKSERPSLKWLVQSAATLRLRGIR